MQHLFHVDCRSENHLAYNGYPFDVTLFGVNAVAPLKPSNDNDRKYYVQISQCMR